MAWLADDIERKVRRRCRIPDGASVMSSSEMREIMDDEIDGRFVPFLRTLRGSEWGVTTYEAGIVADQAEYRIPAAATGGSLTTVTIVDSNGYGAPIPVMPLQDADIYTQQGSGMWSRGAAYVIQDAYLRLLPTPSSTDIVGRILRLRYQRRPNRLVAASTCAIVDGVTSATVCTVSQAGDIVSSQEVDVIRATPGFDVLTDDDVVTISGSSYTLSAGTAGHGSSPYTGSRWTTGDYIAATGFSPIPQIPAELHVALATTCMIQVFQALGDAQQMAIAREELAMQMAAAKMLLSPRVSTESRPIVNRRGGTRGRGGRWRG